MKHIPQIEHIYNIANICELSYRDPSELQAYCHKKPQYAPIIKTAIFVTNLETDAQAYIFYTTDTIYVCFRGTSSTKDKLIDLQLTTTRFLQEHVFVHKGFYDQYQSISKEIKHHIHNILAYYRQPNILCCGHSLGGALATICSVDLKFSVCAPNNVSNVTFGSPRVGNKHFRNLYASLINHKNSFRIADRNDPISYVPILYTYHHVDDAYCLYDNCIKIKKDKAWYKRLPHALQNLNYCNMFHEHSMVNYIELLAKQLG